VRHKALRRAAGPLLLLSIVALVLSAGPVGDTVGLFNAETQNAGSSFAGGWIGAAAGAGATASGYDVNLGWTPGTHGPVTGQQLLSVDNHSTSSCTGAAYALLTTVGAGASSYTNSNVGSGAANGDWFCYRIVSTSATVWTAQTDLSAVQAGFVATQLALANGLTAAKIDKDDTIKITFNQKTNLTASSTKVCAYTSGVVVVGDTSGGGGCPSSPASSYAFGKLTVSGASISANKAYPNSPVTYSSGAPWTATIKLAGGSIANVTGTPTWSLTPSATVATFVNAAATICTAATTNCAPTSTTNF
jgi:hypothetical protein